MFQRAGFLFFFIIIVILRKFSLYEIGKYQC